MKTITRIFSLLKKLSITVMFVFATTLVCLADATSLDSTKDETSVERDAAAISYEMLSPFCPGRALADCPTEQSSKLKAEIRFDLESGKSKQILLEELFQKYGQHLRSTPSMSGWNSLAWITPFIIIVVGVAIVILKIKSRAGSENGDID